MCKTDFRSVADLSKDWSLVALGTFRALDKGNQMSMNQTMASGDRLTLLCGSGQDAVSRQTADAWLRRRQMTQVAPTTQISQKRAS